MQPPTLHSRRVDCQPDVFFCVLFSCKVDRHRPKKAISLAMCLSSTTFVYKLSAVSCMEGLLEPRSRTP